MPDTFTPEQIAQILEEFFRVVGTRQYIGARYVPLFGRKDEDTIEWDNTAPYEPLTIVLYQGNSYTSRQYVPVGVEITNQEFWAITGNYNAQVEQYRRETAAAREIADNALDAATNAQNDINTLLPKTDFDAENTVKDAIDAAHTAANNAQQSANNAQQSADAAQHDIDALLPKSAFSATNTIKKYIDESYPPVNPDRFTGSNDYEKLQAAIDYSKANDYPTIVVGRNYDITGHELDITKGTSEIEGEEIRENLTFIGLGNGCITKRDNGYIFTSNASGRSWDFCFINMRFKGAQARTGCSVFNASKLIRIKTFGCFYENLLNVFDSTSDINSPMQSIDAFGDTVYKCNSYANISRIYDGLFIGATIEECNYGFVDNKNCPSFAVHNMTINDCCMEANNYSAVSFTSDAHTDTLLRNFCLTNCYFEANNLSDPQSYNDIYINVGVQYTIKIADSLFVRGVNASGYKPIITNLNNAGYVISGNEAGLLADDYFVTLLDTNTTWFSGFGNQVRAGKVCTNNLRFNNVTKNNINSNDSFYFGGNFITSAYSDTGGMSFNFSLPLPVYLRENVHLNISYTDMTLYKTSSRWIGKDSIESIEQINTTGAVVDFKVTLKSNVAALEERAGFALQIRACTLSVPS